MGLSPIYKDGGNVWYNARRITQRGKHGHMQLYIIRHGQSTNNVTMLTDVKDRVADPPLTDLGKKQAEAVAHYLKTAVNPESVVDAALTGQPSETGFAFTQLHCSPMLRALQTCQPIAAALGLKPQVWVEIHEHGGMYMDYNDERGIVGFPGLSRTELLLGFPDYSLPDTFAEEGWWNSTLGEEDLAAAHARGIRVAQALRKQAESEERIGIVTHGVFADCLIKALLSQTPGPYHFYSHHNTGITCINFVDPYRISLRFTNRIEHLTPDLYSA
jgi:2,3-bisphosphoglycerate-dependent phosphoglycerate mutase